MKDMISDQEWNMSITHKTSDSSKYLSTSKCTVEQSTLCAHSALCADQLTVQSMRKCCLRLCFVDILYVTDFTSAFQPSFAQASSNSTVRVRECVCACMQRWYAGPVNHETELKIVYPESIIERVQMLFNSIRSVERPSGCPQRLLCFTSNCW